MSELGGLRRIMDWHDDDDCLAALMHYVCGCSFGEHPAKHRFIDACAEHMDRCSNCCQNVRIVAARTEDPEKKLLYETALNEFMVAWWKEPRRKLRNRSPTGGKIHSGDVSANDDPSSLSGS